MDYTAQDTRFKLRKVMRYTRLYGPSRAAVKVRGQYHLKKRYDALPSLDAPSAGARHVGIIGCGNFAFTTIAYYLRRMHGDVLRGVMDVDVNRAASLGDRYGADYYTTDSERIVTDPAIDLIFIASNHASHADYAARALRAGKNVHVEKPHAVTTAQLERLVDAMLSSSGRVGLGFNRPGSHIGQTIRRELEQQRGPGMYNWFVAGHELPPDHWYYLESEGGRVLGNLCHWIDFTYNLVEPGGRYPIRIVPARWSGSDSDVSVAYIFGEGTTAAITFSAKGHTFEGVREVFSGHKGNLLLSMKDFQKLTVEDVAARRRVRHLLRDHGHRSAIERSYTMSDRSGSEAWEGVSPAYVWESGDLVLRTREALERNESLSIAAGWESSSASGPARSGR